MPKKVYTCTHCGVVQMMTPEYAKRGCLLCDGELEESPEATLNFVVAVKSAERVKRLTEIKKRYAEEAMK
jgi:hypothetical protein